MSEAQPVLVSIEGRVGVLELARPEKFNAMTERAIEIIGQALGEFEANQDVRAILIRAQGRNFCTGDDLDEIDSFGSDGDQAGESSLRGHRLLQRLEASHLPVVAAVQGLALAGGLEFMLAADVVFLAENARIGDQHAQFGLIPGWGGTQRLPRIIGMRRALDLMFSARWIDSATAMEWGLANYVLPDDDLQSAAMEYCIQLGTRNGEGIALMKRLAREGMDLPISQALDSERLEIPAFLQSANVAEGVAAFMQKRKPEFR